MAKLKSGEALSLNDGRYVLVEPPHHILPPNIEGLFFNLLSAGYVPILTHPERMSWIEREYALVSWLVRSGVWMQITAAALLGDFGSRAKGWSLRMLREGLVQIVASDAHGAVRRPPRMAEALSALIPLVGAGGGAQPRSGSTGGDRQQSRPLRRSRTSSRCAGSL